MCTILKWFVSHLGNHCQAIDISSTPSKLSKLIYGVPQGSALGPLFFSLHTKPLTKIISLHPDIKFHFYVDDTQLYIHLYHKNASASLAKLNACLQDVQRWIDLSKLKLNPEKKLSLLFLVLRLIVRKFPPIFLSVFLESFFIRLTLPKT